MHHFQLVDYRLRSFSLFFKTDLKSRWLVAAISRNARDALEFTVSRTLIIACGNPLRCDDGLARHVAERLSKLDLSSDVEIITRHQPTPELALPVSQATTVLFIDAARVGVPGEIAWGPLRARPSSCLFTHDCSPAALIHLAQELYSRCAEAFSISLTGECFDHGEMLSKMVEERLPRVVQLVSEFAHRVRGLQTD